MAGFSERAKLTALAIVHVFETSKPFGDYGAVAVLNDGAGVSYGVSQFTHRSGSLRKVINTYLGMGGTVGAAVLRDRGHLLIDTSPNAVTALSNDRQFKDALRFAGETDEMREAQNQIAENFYLLPAIGACEGSGFTLPLSLAVIYDSINHGSYERIRDRVKGNLGEKEWITAYVRARHAWLRSVPRLKATSYRTAFFLEEISDGNWQLDLPIYPHGTAITDAMIAADDAEDDVFTDNARRPGDDMLAVYADTPDPSDTNPAEAGDAAEAPADTPAASPQEASQPATFVSETKEIEAPAATGFLGKLKLQLAALATLTIGGKSLQDWLGVDLSPGTTDLLKVLIPAILGLGFIGFMTWYITEKVIGWKTLKMQAEYATDPTRHDLKITPR